MTRRNMAHVIRAPEEIVIYFSLPIMFVLVFGYVFGSGMAVVVLKRLTDALEAGDVVHAVIKGSAINNDGAVKIGYSASRVYSRLGRDDETAVHCLSENGF